MAVTDSIFNVLSSQRDEISQLQDSIRNLHYSIDQLKSSIDTGIAPFWIILILAAFAVAIGYLFYKMKIMDDFLTNLVRKIKEENKQEKHQQVPQKMVQQHNGTQVGKTGIAIVQRQHSPGSQQTIEAVNTSHISEKKSMAKPHPQPKIVKYASIQEDAQGGLKIAERVMNDDASKMFMVEMVNGDTTATYTFNPRAESSILSDLQTFKNFTEPFTISGTPRKVVEIKKGQLEKNGKFWIVKSKLIIDFKY